MIYEAESRQRACLRQDRRVLRHVTRPLEGQGHEQGATDECGNHETEHQDHS
jgi:hypothetical protein